MDTTEKSREIRLRRAASRQGLALQRSRRRDPLAFDYGTYQLATLAGEVVASGYAGGYGLSLDAVQAELAKGLTRAERRALTKGRAIRPT